MNKSHRLPVADEDSKAKVASGVIISIFRTLVGLRIIAAAGLWYRARSHQSELTDQCFGLSAWSIFVTVWFLYVVCFLAVLLFFREKYYKVIARSESSSLGHVSLAAYRRWVWAVIVVESAFFSTFYLLTMKPESDLFLLFFIPLLNGTTLLDHNSAKKVWWVSVFFLGLCITLMYFKLPFGHVELLGAHTKEKFFVHIFLIRAFAFYMASIPIRLLVGRTFELAEQRSRLQIAHDQLQESQGLYRSLVDTIPQYILRKDGEGRFTFASPGFVKFLGATSLGEVIGKTDADFFPDELVQQYKRDDQRILSGDVPIITQVERNQLRRTGQFLSVKTVKVPFKDSGGKIIGIQAILWDDSDTQREKYKLLKWFLHDTPKPLTTIRDKFVYQIGSIAKRLTPNDRAELDGICQKITDIVDFTTASFHAHGYLGDPHKFEWVPNNTFLISEPIDLVFRVLHPNNCEIVFSKQVDADVEITSDRNKLIAIIYLLAENSVKALAKHVSEKDPIITIFSNLHGDRLVLEVLDNGIGISEENLTRVFDEGFSTNGGTGLGLAIVRGLANLSGGSVKVESTVKKGTKFTVEIGKVIAPTTRTK